MNKGDRVRITDTGTAFDGKEGVLEEIIENGDNTQCTIFVDFIPDEGKKVRQNFEIANVEFLTEGKNKNNKGKKPVKDDTKKEIDCSAYDLSSLVPIKEVFSVDGKYPKEVLVSDYFKNYLNDCYKSVCYSARLKTDLLHKVDVACSRITKSCWFEGYDQPPLQGVPEFYGSKVKELKLGSINNNQIRILYFVVCDKIVFTSILVHKQPALTYKEKESSFRCVDVVYKRKK